LFALLPITASAHAQLIGSDPPAGALLATAPAEVRLFFTEAVTPAGRGLSVYAPDGRLVGTGRARASGTQLSVGVADAGVGTYTVVWTVISVDTHPSRGALTYSVGRQTVPRAPGFASGEVGLVSPLGLLLQSLSRWLHFAGYALGFGSATYALLVARDRRPLVLAGLGVVLLLAAEPLALLAQTASLDVTQTFDADALASMLASPFGRAFGLRIAAALLLWAVLGALNLAFWLRWAVPALGVALALVDGATGHATPALPAAATLLTGVHVASMGFWSGGVAGYLITPKASFRTIAAWSVTLLTSSGIALAILHLSAPVQLLTTPYGLTLMAKLPLAGAALVLAYAGRRRVEIVFIALVLVAAAFLVSLPPLR
jgi:copper transport protein